MMEDMEEELHEQALFDGREREKNKLLARIAELEAALRMMLPSHSGSCCTFDEAGKVIVTVESCLCTADVKWARAALAGKGDET